LGGGLAFLLHSTLTADKHELRIDDEHGQNIVRIGYWDDHVWATIPRMHMDQAMLFCTAHTDSLVAPHSAYSENTTATGFRARESFELRMLVREPPRPFGHIAIVRPVRIRIDRPSAEAEKAKRSLLDRMREKVQLGMGPKRQ
jgi:hypothetical protein